jgi:hypothetical protein
VKGGADFTGVKFTPVTTKFTPLNPQRLFNWGVFHWGAARTGPVFVELFYVYFDE